MTSRRFIMVLLCCFLGTAALWAADAVADPGKEGKQLEKAGKLPEALAVYEKAIQAAPTEDLYRDAGSLLGKMQKLDQAIPLLEDGLKKFPESTPLMNLLGLIKFKKGDSQDAQKIWEKVLTINPNNSFAKEWLVKVNKPAENAAAATPSEPASTGTSESTANSGGTSLVGNPGEKLPLEEQEKLGTKLYKDMSALDKYDLASFDNMHRTVIRKCPDTKWAQESCWRLSSMYLMADDNPNNEACAEVLEHLLKTYPDSPLVPEAKNRLLQSYRGAKQFDKVAALYEELFKLNPNPDEKDYMIWALEYGEALAAINRKDQAKGLYEKIIQLDNNRDQMEARVARERLAGL